MSQKQENNGIQKQVVSAFDLRRLSQIPSEKGSLQGSNVDHNDMSSSSQSIISQNTSKLIDTRHHQSQLGQTNALQSYLSIQQVQSKQIAACETNNIMTVVHQHKCVSSSSPSLQKVLEHSFHNDIPIDGYPTLQSSVNFIVSGLVLFKKTYVYALEQGYSVTALITIGDVVQMVNEIQQRQENNNQKHIPLSHHVNDNIFSIDEYNPVDGDEYPSEKNSHHGKSISLFSRMMKGNLLGVEHTKDNNGNIKPTRKILNYPFMMAIQTTLFTLQQLIITQQQQLLSLKSSLLNILQNKITQQFSNNQNSSQSLFNHNYDRKQISLLTGHQIQLIKERIELYAIVIREIVVTLKRCLLHNSDVIQNSYKSKSTALQSFPTFPSKSRTSLISRHFAVQSLQQSLQTNPNKMTSIAHHNNFTYETNRSTQLLVNVAKQNKFQYNRKTQQHINAQQQQAEFHTLFYDVWLEIVQKKNNTMQLFDDNGDKYEYIFTDIYELLPTEQQAISFLIFVLKQLQHNFINILTTTNQQLISSPSVIYSQKMKERHHKTDKSFQIQHRINSQVSTKRIISPHKKTHQQYNKTNQLLSQTRNINEVDGQYDKKNTNNDGQSLQHVQTKFKQSNAHDSKNLKHNNNSSSKLALSKLYQSKLNNIMKKTQRINTVNEKVKSSLALVNTKSHTSRSYTKSPNHHQQPICTFQDDEPYQRSKNPSSHQSHIKILQLKKSLNEKAIQLQEKQKMIKKLIFMQEINSINSMNEKKHLEVIYEKKMEMIRTQYKEKLRLKGNQIKETKRQVQNQQRYIVQVSQQRRVEAKLFAESNQLYSLKKCLLPKQQHLKIKSNSLANLKKGCYKQLYSTKKNKQNIHQLSNITSRLEEQSLALINNKLKQQQKQPALILKTPSDPLQQLSQKDIILNKINKIQQKIINKNNSTKPIFFSRS